MNKKSSWIKHTEFEPNTAFDYQIINGKIDGKTFHLSQMAPDAWKLEIGTKEILYNVPKKEVLLKFPALMGALKEIKSGLAIKKKERFGLN